MQSMLDLGGGGFSDIESDLIDRDLQDLEGSLANFKLQSRPVFPAPEEKTVVSLNDYSINSTGARVEWYVDGVTVPDSNNKRAVEVTAPKLGDTMNVTARFLFPSGRVSEASLTLRPVQVDIILEPLTHVPVFYRGRSLATQQSTIRAIALVYADGSGKPSTGFSYKWQTNGTVIEGGSLYEGNVIEFDPPLRRTITLELEVADKQGTPVGSKTVTFPLVQPSVLFYEHNPLRGLSPIAVGNPFRFGSPEVTVRAEPYNISIDALNDPLREITWRLNGADTLTGPDPYIITLREQGRAGRAVIDWRFRSPLKQTQSFEGAFAVQF